MKALVSGLNSAGNKQGGLSQRPLHRCNFKSCVMSDPQKGRRLSVMHLSFFSLRNTTISPPLHTNVNVCLSEVYFPLQIDVVHLKGATSGLHVNYDFPGPFSDIQFKEIDRADAGNCASFRGSLCTFAWEGNGCKGPSRRALRTWELTGDLF